MDKEKENVQEEQQQNTDHKASESQKEDSKHEDVPSVDNKEQSEEKTYTQAQVDAMMAKARKKYTKNDVKEEQTDDTQQDSLEQRDLSTGITVEKLAQAELKAEMAIQGINPQKVARAVRLIDVSDVIDETGQYSEKMAQTAIEELLKEWPELKQTSQKESNSFDFGAPEQNEQDPQEDTKSALSKIFGN